MSLPLFQLNRIQQQYKKFESKQKSINFPIIPKIPQNHKRDQSEFETYLKDTNTIQKRKNNFSHLMVAINKERQAKKEIKDLYENENRDIDVAIRKKQFQQSTTYEMMKNILKKRDRQLSELKSLQDINDSNRGNFNSDFQDSVIKTNGKDQHSHVIYIQNSVGDYCQQKQETNQSAPQFSIGLQSQSQRNVSLNHKEQLQQQMSDFSVRIDSINQKEYLKKKPFNYNPIAQSNKSIKQSTIYWNSILEKDDKLRKKVEQSQKKEMKHNENFNRKYSGMNTGNNQGRKKKQKKKQQKQQCKDSLLLEEDKVVDFHEFIVKRDEKEIRENIDKQQEQIRNEQLEDIDYQQLFKDYYNIDIGPNDVMEVLKHIKDKQILEECLKEAADNSQFIQFNSYTEYLKRRENFDNKLEQDQNQSSDNSIQYNKLNMISPIKENQSRVSIKEEELKVNLGISKKERNDYLKSTVKRLRKYQDFITQVQEDRIEQDMRRQSTDSASQSQPQSNHENQEEVIKESSFMDQIFQINNSCQQMSQMKSIPKKMRNRQNRIDRQFRKLEDQVNPGRKIESIDNLVKILPIKQR